MCKCCIIVMSSHGLADRPAGAGRLPGRDFKSSKTSRSENYTAFTFGGMPLARGEFTSQTYELAQVELPDVQIRSS